MFYVYVVSFGLLLYRRPIAVFVLFFVFYFLRTKEEKSKGYRLSRIIRDGGSLRFIVHV